jgi:hypothetical protein
LKREVTGLEYRTGFPQKSQGEQSPCQSAGSPNEKISWRKEAEEKVRPNAREGMCFSGSLHSWRDVPNQPSTLVICVRSVHTKVNKKGRCNTARQLGAFRKGRTITTVLLFKQFWLTNQTR